MKISSGVSDESVLAELGERITRTRLNRNRTQSDLATRAGVSLRTLQRLEGGGSVQLANLVRVLRALGLLENLEGLVPEPASSPIQQVKRRGQERQRASTPTGDAEPGSPWSWEDGE